MSVDELLWHMSTMFFSAMWRDTYLGAWVNNVPGPYLIASDNFYIPNRVHDNISLALYKNFLPISFDDGCHIWSEEAPVKNKK